MKTALNIVIVNILFMMFDLFSDIIVPDKTHRKGLFMKQLKTYFSDIFNISTKTIESYGAINISLINDLPLFIDPFLLFNSNNEDYQAIHNEMIRYLLFLQEEAIKYPEPLPGMLNAWYLFSEVKQNWLGFSQEGNGGHGLGMKFAKHLHKGLRSTFCGFGHETLTQSSHLEKLCLISPQVGRDKISDFTANFAKKYLLDYTEKFAKTYLDESQCQECQVPHVDFNYTTKTWQAKKYYLPVFWGDYVLLTPQDILTRDDTFIRRADMFDVLQRITPSIEDSALRFELNQYFSSVLKDNGITKEEREDELTKLIEQYPSIMDYYIREKENTGYLAVKQSEICVFETVQLLSHQLSDLINLVNNETEFYDTGHTSHDESYKRVMFLKHIIEDRDGYRYFYVDGKPVRREKDLQIMYLLVWYGTDLDVNREVNNGRGAVDFTVSHGFKNKTLVEFKLASNTKLKQNLEKQVEIYKKANRTDWAIKVILFFSDDELAKVNKILNELDLTGCPDIVLINAIDNKVSASNAK